MTENISSWTTDRDYIYQVIIPALGDDADDHDVEGIWQQLLDDEILVYDEERQSFVEADPETATSDFWEIVKQHARRGWIAEADAPGYEEDDEDYGKAVLLDSEGGHEATVGTMSELCAMSAGQVEARVAEFLGLDADQVHAEPRGANIAGDTSYRNDAVTADEWAIFVRN